MLKAALFTILSAASVLVLAGCESHQAKDRSSFRRNTTDLAAQFQQDCSAEYLKVPPTLSPKCHGRKQTKWKRPGIDFKRNEQEIGSSRREK